jgi:hypothetical protein
MEEKYGNYIPACRQAGVRICYISEYPRLLPTNRKGGQVCANVSGIEKSCFSAKICVPKSSFA